ncbi:protein NYNRIN-like [Agrilus planipennis]|uniref:Protein NYNRIN-like n=1 Tax=Agrilus planipennis TaxID=224129 RepID=A0A1W4WMB3_AGRPL|nr:protein NYNRIN-like [Agrilus planipennis]
MNTPLNYTALAKDQEDDVELQSFLHSNSSLKLKKVEIPGTAPLSSFSNPSARFDHVHIDIIVMPTSEGKRWPEAVPLEDQTAETVARAFYENWICRFGVPLRVTTDQGRQFMSTLSGHLTSMVGISHLHTTAYHPQANGMVERLHRQLKAAIKYHSSERWTEVLPTVLLGIRAAWKEDINSTSAELTYRQPLRLPGEFLTPRTNDDMEDFDAYIRQLRQDFQELQPVPGTHHGRRYIFVFKDLATAKQVFVRNDGPKQPLQAPYEGPFPVVKRTAKTLTVHFKGKDVIISVDRVKSAYILPGNHDDTVITQTSASPQQPNQGVPATTRSGRRIRFTDRYQAGNP